MFGLLFYYLYKLISKIEIKALKYKALKICEGGNDLQILGEVHLNVKSLKLGNKVVLYPGAYLWGEKIELGSLVDIGINSIIYSRKGVKVGNNTHIAAQCYIIDSNHGTKRDSLIECQEMESEPIEIGNDVWIGTQCSIIKGAKIGDGAIIGANSMVNSEIPPYAIAYGTPAKIHGYRK